MNFKKREFVNAKTNINIRKKKKKRVELIIKVQVFFSKKQLCHIVLHSVLLCGHAWMQQKSEI